MPRHRLFTLVMAEVQLLFASVTIYLVFDSSVIFLPSLSFSCTPLNLTLNPIFRFPNSIPKLCPHLTLDIKLIDAQKQLESDLGRLKTLIEGLSVAEEKVSLVVQQLA